MHRAFAQATAGCHRRFTLTCCFCNSLLPVAKRQRVDPWQMLAAARLHGLDIG